METIAVIGAGMMGPGIAQVFATHGYSVFIHNRSSEKLGLVHERVRTNLAQMAEYELVEAAENPSILDRIVTTSDLSAACNGASVVIETITESLPLKQDCSLSWIVFVHQKLFSAVTPLCLALPRLDCMQFIENEFWVCTFTSRLFWCLWLKLFAPKWPQPSIWMRSSFFCASRARNGACPKGRSGIYCKSNAARVVARGLCSHRRGNLRCGDGRHCGT